MTIIDLSNEQKDVYREYRAAKKAPATGPRIRRLG
jgi:hypothetical protein